MSRRVCVAPSDAMLDPWRVVCAAGVRRVAVGVAPPWVSPRRERLVDVMASDADGGEVCELRCCGLVHVGSKSVCTRSPAPLAAPASSSPAPAAAPRLGAPTLATGYRDSSLYRAVPPKHESRDESRIARKLSSARGGPPLYKAVLGSRNTPHTAIPPRVHARPHRHVTGDSSALRSAGPLHRSRPSTSTDP